MTEVGLRGLLPIRQIPVSGSYPDWEDFVQTQLGKWTDGILLDFFLYFAVHAQYPFAEYSTLLGCT